MQIRISQPRRPNIFKTVWRDQPVGQAEIPKDNPADSYVPPHQKGFLGGGANQQAQGGQGSNGLYNQGYGTNENFHPQQGQGYNQHASGSGQPYPKQQQKPVDDLVGDLLNTQQHLHSNMQANNDVVHKLQDAQKVQRAAMDMLARQLSQIATSLSEIRGNEGRIPATVKMPGKENVSLITLQPDRNHEGPIMQIENEESSRGESDNRLIKKTEQVGDNIELKREELGRPLLQMADPFFLDPEDEVASEEDKVESEKKDEKKETPTKIEENISVVIQRKRISSKQRDPGMFTLPISIGNIEITHTMCDLGASINVLPLVLVNIIIKVHDVIYPVDFYVIKTTGSESVGTSRDHHQRVWWHPLYRLLRGEIYSLSVKEATKKPTDMEDLHFVEDIAPPVHEYSMEELLQED
ncbi:hypothetical protein AAHA92_02645 [Salvia divinorum]|uniref:Uncharacterized protein n=1 Tax=Salvia divinorum TaxID=28513 RepID=A0ABD1IH92_SALDI